MHLQKYCAAAIEWQLGSLGASCSSICHALGASADDDFEDAVLSECQRVSSARYTTCGFRGVPMCEWSLWSAEQKQTYRLEMLYYFWMANQDM